MKKSTGRVGQILKSLRDAGLAENTLVIFTSDNGAAVGSSLPLRARKGSVYDGGIREPTLMWWPGTIPAGSVCRDVAASIDMMPTLTALCGGTLPERKIDGHDIRPLMLGTEGAKSPHEAYVLMHGPGAVRSGPWKFYPWQEGKGKQRDSADWKPSTDPVQLYDTVHDIGERTNVAAQHPDVVQRLQAAYDNHVAGNQSQPPTQHQNGASGERGFQRAPRTHKSLICHPALFALSPGPQKVCYETWRILCQSGGQRHCRFPGVLRTAGI